MAIWNLPVVSVGCGSWLGSGTGTSIIPITTSQNVRHYPQLRAGQAWRAQVQAQTNELENSPTTYKNSPLDNLLMFLFRRKMVQEVGWDSEKQGYDGLIDVANCLLRKHKSKLATQQASVRILKSLFPPLLLLLFRKLIAPISGGKLAASMTARITAASCQWLMGKCVVNNVDLSDGSSCDSMVFVERCRYLEASKCAGICIHTCKLPTQSFMNENMGVPLYMEPNFNDLSCQFKFGVSPPSMSDDKTLRVPCFETCPASLRREHLSMEQCPKV